MPLKIRLANILALLAVTLLSICAIEKSNPTRSFYDILFQRNTRVFAPPVPDQASFAGEKVPLDIYYVREAFDRELMAGTFMHSTTIMAFKRANRWFPVIEQVLKRNGIPDDFKFLAVAESNLINVVSPAKAEGYWQFLESTGKQYGLEINENVDERYHMEKATEAACKYFKASREKFGSWTLAAASYNRGSEGLSKAIENQKVDNYYDLYLNDETSRYVYRIMAFKEIYNNPVRYGFYLSSNDFYPVIPAQTVKVDSSVASLPAFARSFGISYRVLREFNPWIRGYTFPNKTGKMYEFRIPSPEAIRAARIDAEPEFFFNDTLKIKDLH